MDLKAQKAREGFPPAGFEILKGVFYNPEMELCRDIFSLLVGAVGGKLKLADPLCASGIRGLRYKLENKNVSALSLSDWSGRASECARKNAKKNRIRCSVKKMDACSFLFKSRGEFDFVELDPFGSPVPFLHDAARCFDGKKEGFLSVTATDMAVLCGAAHAACLKNYGAVPLDNEFCHENAIRILIGSCVLACAKYSFGAEPLLSFSHRHYVKVALRLSFGADRAAASVKKMGFVSYCPGCCWREAARMPRQLSCPSCSHQLETAGPLYTGSLWEEKTLQAMEELNASRDYPKKKAIGKMLQAMISEGRVGGYGYYDLHQLAKKHNAAIMGIDDAIAEIRKGGFAAERTHFCPTAVRTDAPHEEIVRRLST